MELNPCRITAEIIMDENKVRCVVAGAGWWSQGWHLPLLKSLPHVVIHAIIEPTFQPHSTIVEDLDNVEQLKINYNCPIFETIDQFLKSDLLHNTDGIIICTPHATHSDIGIKCIAANLNIMMEKPMTTDVNEARLLYEAHLKNPNKIFQINNSANYRPKAIMLHDIITRGDIGEIKHIHAYFGVNLGWLFEDPASTGWHMKTGNMIGNGFSWGQLSHTVSFILKTTNLTPAKAFAFTSNSDVTDADIYVAISIKCTNGATISISGVGVCPSLKNKKEIDNIIIGSKGRIRYHGLMNCDNHDDDNGSLEISLNDGESTIIDGFEFENLSVTPGPESIHNFIAGLMGKEYYDGANCLIGLKTVATIDAIYRSTISEMAEIIII
jgi:predicted dehydrogenase